MVVKAAVVAVVVTVAASAAVLSPSPSSSSSSTVTTSAGVVVPIRLLAEWAFEVGCNTDSHGWQYARAFDDDGEFAETPTSTSKVRRRKWTRKYKLIEANSSSNNTVSACGCERVSLSVYLYEWLVDGVNVLCVACMLE